MILHVPGMYARFMLRIGNDGSKQGSCYSSWNNHDTIEFHRNAFDHSNTKFFFKKKARAVCFNLLLGFKHIFLYLSSTHVMNYIENIQGTIQVLTLRYPNFIRSWLPASSCDSVHGATKGWYCGWDAALQVKESLVTLDRCTTWLCKHKYLGRQFWPSKKGPRS